MELITVPYQYRTAGERTSPSPNIPGGIDRVIVTFDTTEAQFTTGMAFQLAIQIQHGSDWVHHAGVHWIGGTLPPKGGGWRFEFNRLSSFVGQRIRAHAVQTGNFAWGLTVEVE